MDGVSTELEITAEEAHAVVPTEIENNKDWYRQQKWVEKGDPKEKVQVQVGDSEITIVNFSGDIQFGKFSERTRKALTDFQKHFPQALKKLKWILIDDIQPEQTGDPSRFSGNGETYLTTPEGTIVLKPRAFQDIPHRVSTVPNLEGTLTHELGHLVQDEFDVEWKEKFPWVDVVDEPENWIFDKSGEKNPAKLHPPINKITGDVALGGFYPKNPEECVTPYAKNSSHEDICESIVAYLHDPEKLKAASLEKFEAVKARDMTPAL